MLVLPLPSEPDSRLTHDSRGFTFQEQKSSVDSLTVRSPPAGPTVTSVGVTFQGQVAASCEIVARWSETETATDRGKVDRFG
jgi:hypothetical protein